MNDRYLFKAIDTNSVWRTGLLIALKGNRCAIEESDGSKWACDAKTLCQCTGLKDKNGKLIWENDIIHKSFYTDYDACANSEAYIGRIQYEDGGWSVEIAKPDGNVCVSPIIEMIAYSKDIEYCEVIGNIFDNKELLESEEK